MAATESLSCAGIQAPFESSLSGSCRGTEQGPQGAPFSELREPLAQYVLLAVG